MSHNRPNRKTNTRLRITPPLEVMRLPFTRGNIVAVAIKPVPVYTNGIHTGWTHRRYNLHATKGWRAR